MARLAELKAERLKRGQPADYLDQMFDNLEKGDPQEYLLQINQELEELFMETQQVTALSDGTIEFIVSFVSC